MGNGRNIATLTARESQIVERIAWGASQKEVAADLTRALDQYFDS